MNNRILLKRSCLLVLLVIVATKVPLLLKHGTAYPTHIEKEKAKGGGILPPAAPALPTAAVVTGYFPGPYISGERLVADGQSRTASRERPVMAQQPPPKQTPVVVAKEALNKA